MKINNIGNSVVQIKNVHQYYNIVDIKMMDDIVLPGTNLNQDKVVLDTRDTVPGVNVQEFITLGGKSMSDYDPLTGMSKKDIISVKLGNNDSIAIDTLIAHKGTTSVSIDCSSIGNTIHINNMEIIPWYLGEYAKMSNLLTIQVKGFGEHDRVIFNDNTQDIRFVQGASSVRVDIVEQGGSFQDSGDYLGRLNFIGADIATVKNSFQSYVG